MYTPPPGNGAGFNFKGPAYIAPSGATVVFNFGATSGGGGGGAAGSAPTAVRLSLLEEGNWFFAQPRPRPIGFVPTKRRRRVLFTIVG